MKITKLYKEFFASEKAGGLLLVFVTIVSLILANSPWQTNYVGFWSKEVGSYSILHWINDGLMALFFLLIGLELEREIYHGELSNIKNASLPVFAAIGGMLVPAGVFLLFNYGSDTQSGMGIPVATDIAFAIGILSLLGKHVPTSVKIFLTALAVIDDLGAIIVIAIFYTKTLIFLNLFIALGIFGLLILLNRLKVHNLIPYIIGGIAMWYFMHNSGIHATLTGVLLAFAIPFAKEGEKSPSYILQHLLHKPVAFFILPLFAMANTCIPIGDSWQGGLMENSSIGIMAGLIIGKPVGILLFSYLGVGLGICSLQPGLHWRSILGIGFLGGIGFTMSIFITLLAFSEPDVINNSKIAIIVASVVAGTIGYLWLKTILKSEVEEDDQ